MTENEAIEVLANHFDFLIESWKPYPDRKVLDAIRISISTMKEVQQYRAIGTVEECREARKRQREKKPVEYEDKYYACPVCGNVLMYKWEKYPSQLKDKKCGLPYCLSCGQAIDWSDND